MMKKLLIFPSHLRGRMALPPSKSEVLRLILMAACGQRTLTIQGDFSKPCEDIRAMMNVAAALGARCTPLSVGLRIEPRATFAKVSCDVGECAAALRMSFPVFSLWGLPVSYHFRPILIDRCRNNLREIHSELRCGSLTIDEDSQTLRFQPYGNRTVEDYCIEAAYTSQILSGLAIAIATHCLPQRKITVQGKIASRPYLEMTLSMLRSFGASVMIQDKNEDHEILIDGTNFFLPETVCPEADASAAAFPLVMSALGMDVQTETASSSLQGDARLPQILREMSASGRLLPIEIDCDDIPDIAPFLALAATQAEGESHLYGLSRLWGKECDRFNASMEILRRFGANMTTSDGESWVIHGPCKLHGGFSQDCYGDHRMAMLITAAAFLSDQPVEAVGTECVTKSWPSFFEECAKLGGKLLCPAE